MSDILKLIRERQSTRADFDPKRPIPAADLRMILEAARWAPTAHNMQNFQIVVVDDRKLLEAISNIRREVDEVFIRENYEQLSFSEEELKRKKVGVLATMFPPSWRVPGTKHHHTDDITHSFVGSPVQKCSALLVVVYDPSKRAPASEGDFLGIMSLGCVMENMWLMAQSLGIGFHVLSVLGTGSVEREAAEVLGIPGQYKIAFAARIGYPLAPTESLRVRREVDDFAHHNRYRIPSSNTSTAVRNVSAHDTEAMKILIACDGSDCSNAALDDLRYAGLPEVVNAVVLSTKEIASQLPAFAALAAAPGYYFADDPRVQELDVRGLSEAETSASTAADRLRSVFPNWNIETAPAAGSAGLAIVRKAAEWKANLTVVGSNGRTGFRRFLLGSVSQHVLTHARCSVRIGRRHPDKMRSDRPIRLLVGIDGSPDSMAASQCIITRRWPKGTQVRVVGVLDFQSWLMAPKVDVSGGAPAPLIEEELRARVSQSTDQAAQDLNDAGLVAVAHVLAGNPGRVLVAEAEKWNADCVFVGARGLNAIERIFLGSVSTVVAARAHCSVEVVREAR